MGIMENQMEKEMENAMEPTLRVFPSISFTILHYIIPFMESIIYWEM